VTQTEFTLPTAVELTEEMARAIRGAGASAAPAVGGLVAELARINARQWDLEDTTRDLGATDSAVAEAKRAIDRLNLNRHRVVQEIDAVIASQLDQSATVAPLATESPGMVIDRLSVLVIRRARTAAASSRDGAYAERLPALDAQLGALALALDTYLDELRAGTRRFMGHEPLKLYLGPVGRTHGGGTHPG
jgi:hypothetical protein